MNCEYSDGRSDLHEKATNEVLVENISLRRESLGEAAYRQLFQGFLNKTLEPGARLLMDELAEQMGISRTPVREALQRLEYEGVVEAHGRRGYIVKEITDDELQQRYEAREAIEGFAARQATELGGETAKRIRDRYEKLLQRSQNTVEEVFHVNRDFHRMIIEETQNSYLLESFDLLWNRVLTSNIWSQMLQSKKVIEDFDRVHRPLIDAIEAGDPEQTHKVVVDHIHNGLSLHRTD